MRYGITGPYCDVNYGDYAMLPNNLAAFPEPPSVVFSFDEAFTRTVLDEYDLAADARHHEVVVRESAREIPLGRAATPLELLRHVDDLEGLREHLSALDLVVVNGGGYVNDLWAQPHRVQRLLAILAPAIVAAQMGKRVAFTANGYGPFVESAEFFASVLGRMKEATFTCRDALGSAQWLRRLGLRDADIALAPDDLMVMEATVARRTPSVERPANPYIVVETYRPVEELEENMAAITSLQRDLDADVVLLPMNLAHGGEDQAAALASMLPRATAYPIRDRGLLPIEDALHLISGAAFTATDRYHGLVSALAGDAPVTSVIRSVRGSLDYYYRKNAGVLEWRLAPGSYDESDFVALDWSDLPRDAATLEVLTRRQQEAYASSAEHFRDTRAARQALIERIFPA